MTSSEHTSRASEWPYGSLLFLGYFGSDNPAGRRLVRHTTAAFILIVGSMIAVQVPQAQPFLRLLFGAGIPVGAAWMGWAHMRYLAELDELSRGIQTKAFAFAYGAVMVLAASMTGLGMALPAVASLIGGPEAYIVPLLLAEPIRGLALFLLARRYR